MPSDSACSIDGNGPFPVVAVQSVNELQGLVRRADQEGQAIYPLGGRTMLDYGLPPTRPGLAVDLTGLDRVIDHAARDMTITVQAGITIAKLQAVLAAENQQLPIDVPLPDRATLGGALATNASGPRRYGYGTLRDYVIGISVVNDEGHETKAGGRVVKNVAGYDLPKLYVGSLGTLGVITQATLKLRPLPESRVLLQIACPDDRLERLFDALHGSRARPRCLTALYGRSSPSVPQPGAGWHVFVGFEDSREPVDWQVRQVEQELRPLGLAAERAGEPVRTALNDFPLLPGATLTFKADLLPRATAVFCQRVAALAPVSLVQAHAGNGIVIGHVEGDLTADQARAMLTALLDAAEAQGNVIVLRCPPPWKASLPVWGRPRNDAWLMRAVKEKLDPRRLFNPGRFVDGI
jgi:glycolate oxidase FAD binding subunit